MGHEHFIQKIVFLNIHIDTLLQIWGIMALILGLSLFVSRSLKKYGMSRGQFIFESIYDLWHSQVMTQVGSKHIRVLFPYIASLFCFLLITYWSGLFPWKLFHLIPFWPHLEGNPWEYTNPILDVNIPLGLGLLSLVAYLAIGTLAGGINYWLAYLGLHKNEGKYSANLTSIISALIEWLDLLTRPLTLTMRIFANMMAGEALGLAILAICPLVLPLFTITFEFVIGIIQSFIFATLTLVYMSIANAHGHTEEKTH